MRKLKLSLRKEIISDLEAKEVKGGFATRFECDSEPPRCNPHTFVISGCGICEYTKQANDSCLSVCHPE
jgi:hypothetical protein